MASLAGLLSEAGKRARIAQGVCVPATDSPQAARTVLMVSSRSRGADGESEPDPALPTAERSAQPAAAACVQSCPRRQRSAGGVINNVPEIYLTLQP